MNLNIVRKALHVSIIKTLIFNFKYFPASVAIKFPVLVTRNALLKKTKGKVLLKSPAQTGLIKFGWDGVGIFDHRRSRSIWDVEGEVIFSGPARIGHGSKISVGRQGQLILGANFTISAESSIVSHKIIRFGDNCLLSWDILVLDTDFHSITCNGKTINEPQEILIGDNCWIGCRTTVLKGSVIPSGCVIGANALVAGQLTECDAIYGGAPAAVLKEKIEWRV